MATVKALVLKNGQIEQQQPGDTLAGPVEEVDVVSLQATVALTAGNPVYSDGSGSCDKAKADAAGTKDVIGFATADVPISTSGSIQTDGVLNLTTTQWDAIAGTTGGLTAGSWYYLDDTTAGNITDTAPTTPGDFVCPLGIALSTEDLLIMFNPTIKL